MLKQSPAAKVRQEMRAHLSTLSEQRLKDLVEIAIWLAKQDWAQKNPAVGIKPNREIIKS